MTGVQWAVLTAYARTLRPGAERQAVEALTAQGAPSPLGQRVALTVADRAGLTCRGKLTPQGVRAARAFLALRGHPAKGEA